LVNFIGGTGFGPALPNVTAPHPGAGEAARDLNGWNQVALGLEQGAQKLYGFEEPVFTGLYAFHALKNAQPKAHQMSQPTDPFYSQFEKYFFG